MIELIFVIVILGILGAVVIPKLSGIKDDAQLSNANENICVNLKGNFMAYAARHNGSLEGFNVLKYFGVFDYKDNKELFGNFTKYEHLLNSKYLRQVVFGNLNPKKQVKFEEYIICKLFEELQINLGEHFSDNMCLNTDELIFEFNGQDMEKIQKAVDKVYSEFNMPMKVETFILNGVTDKKGKTYFIKEFWGNRHDFEFKATPTLYFNQVFRYYNGMESSKNDLAFYYEGMLAEFKEYLF